MKMSEEMALRLHRMMWSDMQRELGDNPNGKERAQFKFDWIHKHFPSESIANDCWLCEYAVSVAKPGDSEPYCKYCPISWPNRHCNTLDFSYAKEPISEILALPTRNKELVAEKELNKNGSYYEFRENLLSEYSGLPANFAIADHVKAIREKAVDDYFAKRPLAKAMTTDIDNAFKQHAEEQMAPIFHALAKASGLSAANKSVNDHIAAIDAKAHEDMSSQILRAVDARDAEIRMTLAKESDLNGSASIKAHINAIRSHGFEDGCNEERERIQEKIEELLS